MATQTRRFEDLLQAVPDALVGMDQKGVIRFVDRQTESLFGYDRDQLVGRCINTLVPESLWQIYAEHRQNYFADPRARSTGLDLELNGRHQDGTPFPINISLSHIDTGDDVGQADVDRERGAVLVASVQLQVEPSGPRPGVCEVVLAVLGVDLPQRLGNQRVDAPADQLVAVIAEQRLRLTIDKTDHTFLVH